jgi:hypothetical protein
LEGFRERGVGWLKTWLGGGVFASTVVDQMLCFEKSLLPWLSLIIDCESGELFVESAPIRRN